jgi:Flp pilus assembly pilin Flp
MRRDKAKCNRRGAVMMEYVIVGVLIAAACVLGVVVLSRSILYAFDTGARGATADSKKAKESQTEYRKQLDQDSTDAKAYHDSMHTGDMAKP